MSFKKTDRVRRVKDYRDSYGNMLFQPKHGRIKVLDKDNNIVYNEVITLETGVKGASDPCSRIKDIYPIKNGFVHNLTTLNY